MDVVYLVWIKVAFPTKKIPVRKRFSVRPDRPCGPPSLLYKGYRVFPGWKCGLGVLLTTHPLLVPRSWNSRAIEWKRNVMAHAQKPDSVFQRNERVHLYWRGCQFSRVLAFLEWGSSENDCSNTGWTVPSQTEDCLATHSIRLFPLHFSSRASPCATRFRFHSTSTHPLGHTRPVTGSLYTYLLQYHNFCKLGVDKAIRPFWQHDMRGKMNNE